MLCLEKDPKEDGWARCPIQVFICLYVHLFLHVPFLFFQRSLSILQGSLVNVERIRSRQLNVWMSDFVFLEMRNERHHQRGLSPLISFLHAPWAGLNVFRFYALIICVFVVSSQFVSCLSKAMSHFKSVCRVSLVHGCVVTQLVLFSVAWCFLLSCDTEW